MLINLTYNLLVVMFQAAYHQIGLLLVLDLLASSRFDGLQIFLVMEESRGFKIESTVVQVNDFE